MSSLFSGPHRVASGDAVRLRLPLRSDARALVALGERLAAPVSPFDLVRFDPRGRAVLVATAWSDGTERLVGVAAGALVPGAGADLLLAEEDLVAELLAAALAERAAVHASRVA